MCLCTVASEFSFSPCPISSNEGEYPCSVTNREMKSYTSRCLRVIAMPPLLAKIKRKASRIHCEQDYSIDLPSDLRGRLFASLAVNAFYTWKRPETFPF